MWFARSQPRPKNHVYKELVAPLNQEGLRGRNMINIHIPQTALLCWDKLSSDC